MIPAEAVEAAAKAIFGDPHGDTWALQVPEVQGRSREDARLALEAAAPYMQQEVDLMRWKLDALKAWADAMIDESYYPQYGRDVKTILEVKSVDEARGIDAL